MIVQSTASEDKVREVRNDEANDLEAGSSLLRNQLAHIQGLESASVDGHREPMPATTHAHHSPSPVPVNKTDPTKVDLEHMLVLKKSSDEQSQSATWQKIDRHRDKKEKKKRGVKVLSIDEFLGNRQRDFEYMEEDSIPHSSWDNYQPFQQALEMKLEYSHVFEIQTLLVDLIAMHGPVNLDSPILLNALGRLPDACQEALLLTGGIEHFILKCDAFAVMDGCVYLTKEDSKLLRPAAMHALLPPMNPCANRLANNSPIEKKLDVLDAIEAISEGEEIEADSCHPMSRYNDVTNEMPPFHGAESCLHQGNLNNLYVVGVAASLMPESHSLAPPDFAESSQTSEAMELPPMNVADDAQSSKSDTSRNVGRLKYYDIFKRFLRFIPSFSENAQKHMLQCLLNIVVREKVLQRYKNAHGLNIDVETLEKSFCSIAQALCTQSDKQSQTELYENDEVQLVEMRQLREDKTHLQSHLSECLVVMEKLKESQRQFHMMQDHWNRERTVLVDQVNALNIALQTVKHSHPRYSNQTQANTIMEQRYSPSEQESNKDILRNPVSKSLMEFIQTPAMSVMASHSLSSVPLAAAKEDVRRGLDDDRPRMTNGIPLIKTSRPSTPSAPIRMEPSATGPLKSSMMPARNCFERVIGQLRAKFPTQSREELREYVQQLRANHNNSLTGLTIDAIVLEVSRLISDEKQQLLRRRSTHNITFKNMSSLSSQSRALPKSNKERASDGDAAVWSKAGSDNLEWNFDECDSLDVCVICHEEMTEDVCVLQCHHRFHNQCIRGWFQRQSTCPICRVLSLPPDEFPTLS